MASPARAVARVASMITSALPLSTTKISSRVREWGVGGVPGAMLTRQSDVSSVPPRLGVARDVKVVPPRAWVGAAGAWTTDMSLSSGWSTVLTILPEMD